MKSFALVAVLAGGVSAQAEAWAQCGGQDWTGPTTCVDGYTCTYTNDWYSQCVPGSDPAPTSTTLTTSTTAAPAPTSTGAAGSFQWFGVDESVAEFGTDIPGTWGVDFYFPSQSAMQTLIDEGYNIFRVPFMMERMVPDSLTGSFDTGYLTNYTDTINFITGAGAYAVVDPHNYGRYYDNIIESTADFQTFWENLAGEFSSSNLVIFDTNNEYNSMDQQLVYDLNQAAIDGIRAAGATSQYIFVEGNQWSGAWSWNTTNTDLDSLIDPQDMIVYEMHQYLDSDSSGTSPDCVSADIGVQRIVGATDWLRANSKVGFLGEFAGGANDVCLQAVTGMLDHMASNSDVWLGAAWWAAGPWWGTATEYTYEPPDGTAYVYYDSTLQQYTP